jgi:amidohydrolase
VTGVDALKATVRQTIDACADSLVGLSLQLHANVEFSLQEVRAQSWLCDLLEAQGFAVERGLGSLPTAFRAVAGSGSGPTIAMLCEYDGLAPYGHSCGHNVVAAAAVGAGIGVKSVIGQLGGTVVVLGTPGEEGGGGKYILRDEGFFDGIDAMMLVYPGAHDIADSRTVTAGRGRVEFFGKAAHAAARPEFGVNALDAMLVAFTALNALRQQLPSDTRVHGIVTKGGTLGNVIPDHTSATVSVRANSPERVAAVLPRVRACFEGAAIATGCRIEQAWTPATRPALLSNRTMAALYGANLGTLGRTPRPRDELSGAWSGDTSAVSWLVPTIQPQVAMTDQPPHSHEFHAASATPAAAQAIRDAAVAMAATGVDLIASPETLDLVRDEHSRSVAAASTG